MIGHTVRRVVGLLRVFEQDTRFKSGPILLPDPGEFESSVLLSHLPICVGSPSLSKNTALRFLASVIIFEYEMTST